MRKLEKIEKSHKILSRSLKAIGTSFSLELKLERLVDESSNLRFDRVVGKTVSDFEANAAYSDFYHTLYWYLKNASYFSIILQKCVNCVFSTV